MFRNDHHLETTYLEASTRTHQQTTPAVVVSRFNDSSSRTRRSPAGSRSARCHCWCLPVVVLLKSVCFMGLSGMLLFQTQRPSCAFAWVLSRNHLPVSTTTCTGTTTSIGRRTRPCFSSSWPGGVSSSFQDENIISASSPQTPTAKEIHQQKYQQLMDASKLQLAPMMEYTDRHFRH